VTLNDLERHNDRRRVIAELLVHFNGDAHHSPAIQAQQFRKLLRQSSLLGLAKLQKSLKQKNINEFAAGRSLSNATVVLNSLRKFLFVSSAYEK